jgi:hypothetical protein
VVDRLHGLRGGRAGGAAPPRRRGDLVSAGRRPVGESIAVALTERVALAYACSKNVYADRSSAEPDAGPDPNACTHTGPDGRALGARQHRPAADPVALTGAAAVVRWGRRDCVAALLADEMNTVGVLLELGRRLEALAALTTLEI